MEEDASNNRHDHNVVSEGPKQVNLDKQISLFQEADQSQNLIQIFGKDYNICCIDIELRFGVDTDTNSCLL